MARLHVSFQVVLTSGGGRLASEFLSNGGRIASDCSGHSDKSRHSEQILESVSDLSPLKVPLVCRPDKLEWGEYQVRISWCPTGQSILLVGALLTAVPTAATAAVINIVDFEAYAVGDILPAFTDLGGVYFNHAIQILGADHSFPPFATGNVAVNYDDFGGDFSGGFIVPIGGFDIAVGDNDPDLDSALLRGFDSDHQLLGGQQFVNRAIGTILSNLECLSHPAPNCPIKYFSVDQEGGVVFDNIRLHNSEDDSVPEPASLLLFGTGALGVIVRLRRRNRHQP